MNSQQAYIKDKEEFSKVDVKVVEKAIHDNEKTIVELENAFRGSSKKDFISLYVIRRMKQANIKLKYFIKKRRERMETWEH